jgi:uncharacterized protein
MLWALLLPWLVLAAPPLDCGNDAIEQVICADPALRAQQSQVRELYGAAVGGLAAAERSAQQQREARWQHERAACAGAQDPHGCLVDQLSHRLVELKIALKEVAVFAAVTYRCDGPDAVPLLATYYRSEPAAVRLKYRDQDALAFIAPSASGARYLGDDVEIWEHQGVARFTWHGQQMSCPKQSQSGRLPEGARPH